jgi:hypothetical protein
VEHKSQTLWNLESLVRSNREQLCSIEQQAGYCNDGSKDCCINNLTLLSIILIYSTVKDLVLSHFDLVRDPRCFFKSQTRFQILDSMSNQNDSQINKITT